MRTIIYKKSNLQCVGVVDGNTTFEWELEYNVIPNFGGFEVDYDFVETNHLNNIELQLIDGVVTAVEKITVPIVPPTIEDQLAEIRQENTLLKAQSQANADRADFQEELIVEMAMIVYS